MNNRQRTHDPLANQREAERLERVERLLAAEPRLTKASAMVFDAEAAREAEQRAAPTNF